MNKKEMKIVIAEKLDYILDTYMSASDVTKKFGFGSNSMISSLRNKNNSQTLLPVHQEGLEKHFDIPMQIWDKSLPMDKKSIDSMIKEYKESKQKIDISTNNIFKENKDLLDKLIGDWYGYFYSSNIELKIHSIKTTIDNNYNVIDENNNRGKLFLGTNQSMIIKESFNSKNLVSITFTNIQVAYEIFSFSLVSKQDQINNEMFNFGFFSREELDEEVVIKTLGDIGTTQLKIDREFLERLTILS